jgi:hypothetical protein
MQGISQDSILDANVVGGRATRDNFLRCKKIGKFVQREGAAMPSKNGWISYIDRRFQHLAIVPRSGRKRCSFSSESSLGKLPK